MRYIRKQDGNAGDYSGFYRKVPCVELLKIAGKWLDGRGAFETLDFA